MSDTETQKGKKSLSWTERGLVAIKAKSRTDFTDPDEKGLVLRVTPSGTKTWALVYRRKSDGKKGRVTIGTFGDCLGQFTLKTARDRAVTLRSEIIAGRDPGLEAATIRKAETVSELLDAYLANHPKPTALWTIESGRKFEKDVKPLIGHIKLPDLNRQHIRAVLKRVADRNAKATVNRTLAAVRRALSWAVQEDLLLVNPAAGIVTNITETPKDRALSQDEIRLFWQGLDDAPMGLKSRLALRLVLLTGQRPGEVCGILKSELDLDAKTWTLPKGRTKNGKPHAVPLHPLTIELLQEAIALDPSAPFLFCTKGRTGNSIAKVKAMDGHALSHAMRDSLAALALADNPATPHDLRRTAATHMARFGITDHVVGKVLNHGTELRRTITARVYITHDFLTEKKVALDAWGNEIERLIGRRGVTDNVVNLRA
jgi:integrase